MADLTTEHIDIWTTAQTQKANGGRGRGKNANGQSQHGIKKLRELILELAVRGKLVPQDPNDEPANILLKRITEKKSRLIKEGKIKKQKPLPEITEEERSFDLPQGWELVRLGEITDRIGSGSTPRGGRSAYVESGIPFLRSQNVWNHGLELGDVAFITEAIHQKMSNTMVLPNDILLNITGASLGRCSIFPDGLGEANVSQHVTIIRPTDSATRFYLHLCILSPYTQELVWGRQVGMAREGLSKKVLELFEIPCPPLSEQHRIVAKVDELMALCDQLEQQQTDSNATHQILVENLLSTLTTATDQRDFAKAWQRIANHFDALFTTEQSIDHFKQTILQLAVMGKLVPQDPKDEPASVLLEKIAKEKARLIKEGEIRKQKPLQEITEDENSFELPEGWEWVRLGTTGIGSTGKTPNTRNPQYYDGAIPFLGPGQITIEGDITESDKTLTEEGCQYSVIAESGAILMVCIGGSIGKSAIVRSKVAINQQINCIRPLYIDSTYLNVAMNTPHFQTSILDAATGSATPIINRSKWEELLVALPPLSEQHRIVTRIDELSALCDTLKARLKDAQTTQVQLADTIVEQAVA